MRVETGFWNVIIDRDLRNWFIETDWEFRN